QADGREVVELHQPLVIVQPFAGDRYRTADRVTSVVDQDIDATRLGEQLARQLRAGRRVGDVAEVRAHRAAARADLSLDVVELAPVACSDEDVRSRIGKPQRRGAPDA